jgi:hypothetical protein
MTAELETLATKVALSLAGSGPLADELSAQFILGPDPA